jgi:hypothetical protein
MAQQGFCRSGTALKQWADSPEPGFFDQKKGADVIIRA